MEKLEAMLIRNTFPQEHKQPKYFAGREFGNAEEDWEVSSGVWFKVVISRSKGC